MGKIDIQFLLAMANRIHTGFYDPPLLQPDNGGCEWLIIRRWGDQKQFLEISDTMIGDLRGSIPDCKIPRKAPDALRPFQSMLGLMVRRHSETDADYLLVRGNPGQQKLSGRFYPVDGYAQIRFGNKKWTLSASGRHAHDETGADIPHPHKGQGMSWHFDAQYRPWNQEHM